MMTEEEFAEFYWSLSDEERVEITRHLHNLAKENKKIFGVSDEQIAEREAKIDKYERVIKLQKQVGELLHKYQTQLDLVTERIDARLQEIDKSDEEILAEASKNRSSH